MVVDIDATQELTENGLLAPHAARCATRRRDGKDSSPRNPERPVLRGSVHRGDTAGGLACCGSRGCVGPACPNGERPPANFLALSGGGEKGAFGAGLMVGWSESGQRPEFKLVTGVSTGALIAPFAFLGPSRDQQLRRVFTDITQKDVFSARWLMAALYHDALSDTAPLFTLISEFVNAEMLADIAREYYRGRLLFIGTTNLDVQRPVIWNVGAIAASQHPGALDLVRKIGGHSWRIPASVNRGRNRWTTLQRNARRRGSYCAGFPLSTGP